MLSMTLSSPSYKTCCSCSNCCRRSRWCCCHWCSCRQSFGDVIMWVWFNLSIGWTVWEYIFWMGLLYLSRFEVFSTSALCESFFSYFIKDTLIRNSDFAIYYSLYCIAWSDSSKKPVCSFLSTCRRRCDQESDRSVQLLRNIDSIS